MSSVKKIIGLMTLALFCMGSQCQGTLKKDPEGLYRCHLLKANEAPESGTWVNENGDIITGEWTYYYEVPVQYGGSNNNQHVYRFIENENNELMACEDPRPDGRGECFSQDVAEGFAGHEPVCIGGCNAAISASDKPHMLYAQDGKIEACRKVKIFNGVMVDQKRKGLTTVEKYNSKFGHGSSECKLALVSGPPTCGGF
jgi:hypothetical protein